MAKKNSIANHNCVFDGKVLQTDAHGNNAAFNCPHCGHAVLIVSGPAATHGWLDCEDPSECRGCKRKYRVKEKRAGNILRLVECDE